MSAAARLVGKHCSRRLSCGSDAEGISRATAPTIRIKSFGRIRPHGRCTSVRTVQRSWNHDAWPEAMHRIDIHEVVDCGAVYASS